MDNTRKFSIFVLISPIIIFLFTRIGIEISIRLFNSIVAWIPSFIFYYISISIVVILAFKFFPLPKKELFNFSFGKFPNIWLLLFTIIFPALIPLNTLLSHLNSVPILFFLYILIFSLINPFFEEIYWRGILYYLPFGKIFSVIYSAVLFSFSHYFFWSYWFKTLYVIIPVVISTFIMGILWMIFMKIKKKIIYPIISHIIVDIFNLSVAVYCGIIDFVLK